VFKKAQGAHWCNLENKSEPFICGRDAAFLLNYFDHLLWPPYIIGQAIIFFPCGFFFLSSPNLSSWRLDVYHTYTHGVALVQI